MTMARTHKDIEFAVNDGSGQERIFKNFDAAAGFAVALAASDGRKHHIDVLIYSVSGARAWGGDDAVEEYRSDPDANVSDRITVSADHVGRVY